MGGGVVQVTAEAWVGKGMSEGRKLMQKPEGRGCGFIEVKDMCLESGTRSSMVD